jgi:hypothetical protein
MDDIEIIYSGKKDEGNDLKKAIEVSDVLLKLLDDWKIHENEAQTALGYAWFRLLKAMGMPFETFKEICQGMMKQYKEDKK